MKRILILNIYPYNSRIDLARVVFEKTGISSEHIALAESTYLPFTTPVEVIDKYTYRPAFIRWTEIRSWVLDNNKDLASVLPYSSETAKNKFYHAMNAEKDSILSMLSMDLARVNALRWLELPKKNNLDYYIRQVSLFWKAYFKIYDINTIFCGLHPHSLEDLIGCLVALEEGILCRTLVGGSLNIFGLVAWETGHLLSIDCNHTSEIESMISRYWQKSRQKGFYMGSGYMGAMAMQTNIGLSVAKQKILDAYTLIYENNVTSLYAELIREYQRVAITLDLAAQKIKGRKCYYLPWQAQPEATTVPGAMEWHHQVKTTLTLRNEIEPDAVLLVKEHPYQFLVYGELPDFTRISAIQDSRELGCYEKINDLPNTFILDLSAKSSAILALLSPHVVASTGSTGMEAYFSGNYVYQLPKTLSLTGEFLQQEGLIPLDNIDDRLNRAINYFGTRCVIRQKGYAMDGTRIEPGDLFETEAIDVADSNTLKIWCNTIGASILASAHSI